MRFYPVYPGRADAPGECFCCATMTSGSVVASVRPLTIRGSRSPTEQVSTTAISLKSKKTGFRIHHPEKPCA